MRTILLSAALAACANPAPSDDSVDSGPDTDIADTDVGDSGADTDTTDSGGDTDPAPDWDAYADAVVEFLPGEFAGFGADAMPDVVLGAPRGGGPTAGSLDVVTLGKEGVIVLELSDFVLVDGEGPDLLVFENPFPGWLELGVVAVSDDGETWHEWTCDPEDAEGGFPGCAGVEPVLGNLDEGIDPTDPAVAGGDAFDLADLGVETARYVRIRDTGTNEHAYAGNAGGFDLDAIAVVNGEPVD